MPFASKAQSNAAFGGYLGPEMKSKAQEFAKQTDYSKLPAKVGTNRAHRVINDALTHAQKAK